MLRLFTRQGFGELWKGSHFVTSGVAKRPVLSFLPFSSSRHLLNIHARHLNTGIPVWKDTLQPKRGSEDVQTPDLDKWKSVMRAQATSEEKQVNYEAEATGDYEDLKEPGSDLKDSSTLEATRDLVTMWRHAGKLVPQEMTDDDVQMLAQLTTKSSRKKYLKYLAIKEGHKRAHKEKQQQRKAEREASMVQRGLVSDAEEERASELKNTLFLQFWGRSLDKHLAWRSAQAMMYGQPLVFDMSYESNMSRREIENTVSQLIDVEAWNRRATEPFHLHFCNLQMNEHYQKELVKRYGVEAWDRLLVTCTDQQHVDLFPRKQLVYLTADSPNVLRTYDHSKVYIIGALVDRSIQPGLSLANAKRLNLTTARLPLDEFLHWETGGKNLTLDQMIRIMLTLKETGNWEEALEFVPKRKYDGFHHQQTQKNITNTRVREVTHHGPRQDRDRIVRCGERNNKRTIKNEDQSLYRSHKEPGFSDGDRMTGWSTDRENKPAATRVRTSFKSNIEGGKGAGKGKMWWDEE